MMNLQWLMALAIASLIPLAVIVVFHKTRLERNADRQRRLTGIRMNRQIRQLLADLQQHRGMVNALLSGDKSFAPKISQKQTSIERDMASLDARLGEGLLTPQRWQRIRVDWKVLSQQATGLPAEDSFHRHSELIREVIHCLGDVSERALVGGHQPIDPVLVSILWRKLPVAAEGVGQARGMGASVAAKGYCSSVSRIKLRFLEARIRETMGWVSDDLAKADLSKAGTMSSDWHGANATITQFLDLLENALLRVEHPSLDAAHYFDTATQALEAVLRVYDQASDALESATSGRA